MQNSLIENQDGKTVTNSIKIAKYFNKRHDNVLRDIQKLECSANFRVLNFEETSIIDRWNRPQPMFLVSRDGFAILAMGFTGRDAMRWKEQFIAAFNEMEAQLRSQTRATLTPKLRHQLMLLIRQRAYELGGLEGWTSRESRIHRALEREFGVGSYRELPLAKFGDASHFVNRWGDENQSQPLLFGEGTLALTVQVGPQKMAAIRAAAVGDFSSLAITLQP